MDHCVVDDGAKVDGCVLGKNTHIGGKAELTRCVTQAGFEVEAGGAYKQEKLEASDWTAAPPEEDEDSEEDEDEDEEEEGSEDE